MFSRRKPGPAPAVLPDPHVAADDLMVLISSVVYDKGINGPARDVLVETTANLPHMGTVLGTAVGVLAYNAAVHPEGREAGLAEVRRVIDSGIAGRG